ncbi:MAG TPA: 3-dehydroquinate synthase family protein [Planctomycetota bacterium]|nr:3-dehydroquinate synthase family protein [Planctomycetota bacterium]
MGGIGEGILEELPRFVGDLAPSGVFVVADEKVLALHPLPLDAPRLALPGGEGVKTVATWQRVIDALVAEGLDRDGVVVAFGGGALLDVAGFAAATYLRGVRWVAVPTTLLAQVDAAYGGKTAIDHPAAKNLVGAFHAPACVVSDTDLLETLPEREVRSGLAEVVKHAVIGAPGLLDRAGRVPASELVAAAAGVKLAIVARDPLEKGDRRLLNLGHTLGHAYERASGYALSHGEAVALGLRAACRIAARHCGFREGAAVEAALDRCGLPSRGALPFEALEALKHDKKRAYGKLRWVLPVALQDVRVFGDVPEALVKECLP